MGEIVSISMVLYHFAVGVSNLWSAYSISGASKELHNCSGALNRVTSTMERIVHFLQSRQELEASKMSSCLTSHGKYQ